MKKIRLTLIIGILITSFGFSQSKSEIENQKRAAINEVKKEVGAISVSIAERLVKEKLNDNDSQQNLVSKLVNESLSSN